MSESLEVATNFEMVEKVIFLSFLLAASVMVFIVGPVLALV